MAYAVPVYKNGPFEVWFCNGVYSVVLTKPGYACGSFQHDDLANLLAVHRDDPTPRDVYRIERPGGHWMLPTELYWGRICTADTLTVGRTLKGEGDQAITLPVGVWEDVLAMTRC